MKTTTVRIAACTAVAAVLAACGGGSSDSGMTSNPTGSVQLGTMPVVISDASSDDWALIGVRVLSIALVPSGGGSNVTVYTAGSAAPYLNLEQLDNLGEILGNVSVPVGSYTGAVLTIGANPGDVLLTVAPNPESGFAGNPGEVISSDNIQIQHTRGSAGSLTATINVNFSNSLVIDSAGTPNPALDLEFDLSHPAFIVGHEPPGAGTTLWAVNFQAPVHRHPIADLTRLVLRHAYGNVMSVASDGSSITISKQLPAFPIATPETAVATSQQLMILADSTNGTLFYDVDAKTSTSITNFSSETSLAGKFVRVAARYQQDGTLVATRIWASGSFANVWLSPEGHVVNVNRNTDVITVTNEQGVGIPLQVNANTQFFFRQPWSGIADATPIGTGTGFLSSQNLVRGFKVHASVVDPLARPLVAQSIDIEAAAYSGAISQSNSTGFTYTHDYLRAIDDYTFTLPYLSSSSTNPYDPSGSAITGFEYWNFAFPTLVTSGSAVTNDFVQATDGTVSFGGGAAPITAYGTSSALWNDPASPNAWSAPWTILLPVPLPLASVATGVASDSFTVSVPEGTQSVTVNVNSNPGSATLVYQVDRTGGILTISPLDIGTSSGLNTFTTALSAGTPVKVYGIPQADGTLNAYVVTYFTGMMPML
ncbi:MAG TPA: DUF5666 domain-containing protein [Steroidobacteraceae bacterium]|nr:DUF5666 domain-containing protein [Steroidobacteraceae bacterium]